MGDKKLDTTTGFPYRPVLLRVLALPPITPRQLHSAWIMPRCPGSHNIGLPITDGVFDKDEESEAA